VVHATRLRVWSTEAGIIGGASAPCHPLPKPVPASFQLCQSAGASAASTRGRPQSRWRVRCCRGDAQRARRGARARYTLDVGKRRGGCIKISNLARPTAIVPVLAREGRPVSSRDRPYQNFLLPHELPHCELISLLDGSYRTLTKPQPASLI
jgi:hypothetical protein